MENIIDIKGNVQFRITLDPSVWIFDDRKIDLDTYFDQPLEEVNELNAYTYAISKHWDREIKEGATIPPTSITEKKFEKEKMLNGTFGMKFEPFFQNAGPNEDAKLLIIETIDDEISFPIDKANEFLLGFSYKGKPLKKDGPVHIYFRDGSNRNNPIKNVKGLRVE